MGKLVYSSQKICIICRTHGEFLVSPNNFLNGRDCPVCRKNRYHKKISENGIDSFIERASKIHNGKYDYSKVNYVNARTKVCIICPEHGEFWQTPDTHINKEYGCPFCKESKLEKKVQKILNDNHIFFIRQYTPDFFKEKKSYSYQKCDFYIPSKNIVIECQGEQHFKPFKNIDNEDGLKRRISLDVSKNKKLNMHDVRVLYVISKSISIEDIVNNAIYEDIYDSDNCIKENTYLERNIILKLTDNVSEKTI